MQKVVSLLLENGYQVKKFACSLRFVNNDRPNINTIIVVPKVAMSNTYKTSIKYEVQYGQDGYIYTLKDVSSYRLIKVIDKIIKGDSDEIKTLHQ